MTILNAETWTTFTMPLPVEKAWSKTAASHLISGEMTLAQGTNAGQIWDVFEGSVSKIS